MIYFDCVNLANVILHTLITRTCAFIDHYNFASGWDDGISDSQLMEAAQQAEMEHYHWGPLTDLELLQIVNSIEENEKAKELLEIANSVEENEKAKELDSDTHIVNSIEQDDDKMELENEERKRRARSLQRGKQPRRSIIIFNQINVYIHHILNYNAKYYYNTTS